jgi:hypothetical protein
MTMVTFAGSLLVLNPDTGTIGGFIGLLADRSSHRANLDALNEAAASGWAAALGLRGRLC